MKKIIFIFMVFISCMNIIFAQTQYYSDTLFNDFRDQLITNMIKTNRGYSCTLSNLDMGNFNVVHTDNYLHQTSSREWNVFDSLRFHHYFRGLTTLNNKNKLIVGVTWRNIEQYGALIEMDSLMMDTIRTKKISVQYNGLNYITTFYDGVSDVNDDIWIIGAILPTDATYELGILLKLDSDYNIIAQHIFDFPNTTNRCVYKPLFISDGGCIVRGITRTTTGSCTSYQVFVAKVDSLCNRLWYKEYGTPNMPDGNGTVELFESIYPDKFWLMYGEGQRIKSNDPYCQFPDIRFKAVLLDYNGNEYLTKYMTDTLRYCSAWGRIQLPDKSIVLGIRRTFQDDDDPYVMNFGSLYKFSPNMDSLWRKLIVPPRHFPLGYEENIVTSILQESNGDFICGGRYRAYDQSYPQVATPWIARIDSTGCGELACAVVPTENLLNPPQGDFLRVFPNPSHNYITFQLIDMNDYTPANLQIYDTQGRSIETINFINSYTLNTTNLSNGIYFYKYIDDGGLNTQGKISIQH